MVSKEEKPYIPSEKAAAILDNFRLMDDNFMTLFFDQNFEATALMLRIILDQKDIVVKRIEVQKVEKNPTINGRNVILDIFAEDAKGKNYDIEVQRADRGAARKRARFLSGVLDSRMLKKNEDFSRMCDSYVIFITENDVMEKGLAMYHVNRHIEELDNKPFDDGNHIIYVNGAYKNDSSDIGRLMHDFRCTSSVDMFYDVLKDGMHHYKETEGGRTKMCKAIEAYGEELRLEGILEGKAEGILEGKAEGEMKKAIETAKSLKEMGMDVPFIAEALKVEPTVVKHWLGIQQTK